MPTRAHNVHSVHCRQGVPGVIKFQEWQSLLDHCEKPDRLALTASAWQRKLGRSREKTREWISQGLENGWLERAATLVEEITGRSRRQVGFRLVKK